MALTMCDSDNISKDFISAIKEIGQKWRNDRRNPVNDPDFISSVGKWDDFIKKWASDENLPLLIRKKDFDYGTINKHDSGRELVSVDNSPAQWIFASVCMGLNPPDIIDSLEKGNIPVAMVVPKTPPGVKAFKGALRKNPHVNNHGWYLAHKQDVGLNKKMLDCTIGELKDHFIKLMSPLNMFVVPKDKRMRGLAEVNDFIDQQ